MNACSEAGGICKLLTQTTLRLYLAPQKPSASWGVMEAFPLLTSPRDNTCAVGRMARSPHICWRALKQFVQSFSVAGIEFNAWRVGETPGRFE